MKHDWHNIIIGHGILWCDRCGALKFPPGTNQTMTRDSRLNTGYILPENLINHPVYLNLKEGEIEEDGPCVDIRDDLALGTI